MCSGRIAPAIGRCAEFNTEDDATVIRDEDIAIAGESGRPSHRGSQEGTPSRTGGFR